MLPGLEDMLVNLTDAADRALCSALVQPIVQGLKLRSKKSTKARALAVAAHSGPGQEVGRFPTTMLCRRRSEHRADLSYQRAGEPEPTGAARAR